jgi:hypothetical protein
VAKSGLFWTIAVPSETLVADLAAGTATYRATDLRCRDSGVVANGIVGGPSLSATVSWDMRWSGVTGRSTVKDETNRFRLDAVETKCVIDWSAEGPGEFSFKADPNSSNAVYALVGRERNGVFF